MRAVECRCPWTVAILTALGLSIGIFQAEPCWAKTQSLAQRVSAAQSLPADIVLEPGVHAVSKNLSIPANVTLVFKPGALLEISGATVTHGGGIEAGAHTIFRFAKGGKLAAATPYSGRVVMVRPEWWGAKADGKTDCTQALRHALSYAQGYPKCLLSPGHYRTTGQILGPDTARVHLEGPRPEVGVNSQHIKGWSMATIEHEAADGWLIDDKGGNPDIYISGPFIIRNLAFRAKGGGSLIRLGFPDGSKRHRAPPRGLLVEHCNFEGVTRGDMRQAALGHAYISDPTGRVIRNSQKILAFRGFDMKVLNCSFYGGDTAIYMKDVDSPRIENCRIGGCNIGIFRDKHTRGSGVNGHYHGLHFESVSLGMLVFAAGHNSVANCRFEAPFGDGGTYDLTTGASPSGAQYRDSPGRNVQADGPGNRILVKDHHFRNGDTVFFMGGGTPKGISVRNKSYTVTDAAKDSFRISESPNGPAVNFEASKRHFFAQKGLPPLGITASAEYGSPVVTFSQDMRGLLFADLSVIRVFENRQGKVTGRSFEGLVRDFVENSGGRQVRLYASDLKTERRHEFVLTVPWSAGGCRVERILCPAILVGPEASVMASNCEGSGGQGRSTSGPAPVVIVQPGSRPSMIHGWSLPKGRPALVIGNRGTDGSPNEPDEGVTFVACSPKVYPPASHPFANVVDMNTQHGTLEHTRRSQPYFMGREQYGPPQNGSGLLDRVWSWTPKTFSMQYHRHHDSPLMEPVTDDNGAGELFCWRFDSTVYRYPEKYRSQYQQFFVVDATLPRQGRIALRIKARGINGPAALMAVPCRLTPHGPAPIERIKPMTLTFDDAAFTTKTVILDIPAQLGSWTTLDAKRSPGFLFGIASGNGVYCPAISVEEVASSGSISTVRSLTGYGPPDKLGVKAPPGSMYLNLRGGSGSTLYVKESGLEADGWVAK